MRLIDKDMLIEILGEMQGLCDTKAALIQNSKIWQQVKDRPTVDAVPKWIPGSERLPQTTWQFSDCESFKLIDNEVVPVGVYSCYESDPVLVCGSYDGKSGIFTAIYDEWKHEDGAVETGWRDNVESEAEYMVIAWMPLPKPYDAEREE